MAYSSPLFNKIKSVIKKSMSTINDSILILGLVATITISKAMRTDSKSLCYRY